MANKTTAVKSCKDPIKLISLATAAGKDLFLVCFAKADRKTKLKALPLLQKVNDLEITSAIFEHIILSDKEKNALDGAVFAKLQTQTARIQDDLANVKAKVSCNENMDKQLIMDDVNQFCDALEDIEKLLQSVDDRLESESKSYPDEEIYKMNLHMIQADIKLLESERGRNKCVAGLRDLQETRRVAELRLIDAFEVSAMEAESRQINEADRHKKKLEARAVKMETNHTEIEMAHMELGKERRVVLEKYVDGARKRFVAAKNPKTRRAKPERVR